jgi:hypothetical protein
MSWILEQEGVQMIEFAKKEIKVSIEDYFLQVNTDEPSLQISNLTHHENLKFAMEPVYNDKIKAAFEQGKIFLDLKENLSLIRKPLYLSSRSIMTRKIGPVEFYMDVIVYNSGENILPGPTLNRSLGHENDLNELEVFQILDGKVLSILKSPAAIHYYGVFAKGEYFETPPGWFHCTYILEGPAMVANFYCNAFWKNDISKKPYFKADNEITVERTDNEVIIKNPHTKLNLSSLIGKKEYHDNSLTLLPYDRIKESARMHRLVPYNIFDLFNSNILEDWLKNTRQ